MLPGKRTNDGALYVTQGPPPAGTPLVGGIAVSHTGVIYVSQSFVQPFTPADLFKMGEQGAWYDPSDLSTMFQDSAGTTPVTADGQPVGKILDKSGRGNHASQATAASRPLYKTDGTYHWLQFDGVDDSLSTAAVDFSALTKISIFTGVRKIGDAQYSTIVSQFGNFVIYTPSLDPDTYDFRLKTNLRETAGNYAVPITNVLSVLQNLDGATAPDQTSAKINGSAVALTYGPAASGTFANLQIFIGAEGDSYRALNGNIYSLIIRGALSTTQQITDTETWVNGKTGAY